SVELEPAPIGPIIDSAVRSRSATLGISVVVEVVPPDLEVACSAILLERLVANLVTNAFDALEGRSEGHVVVRASVAQPTAEPWEPGRIELTVDDDGPGLPPELGDAVFEPLTTTKKSGTGIGLALCRAIALAHGGDISADRSPLGGARFAVL